MPVLRGECEAAAAAGAATAATASVDATIASPASAAAAGGGVELGSEQSRTGAVDADSEPLSVWGILRRCASRQFCAVVFVWR